MSHHVVNISIRNLDFQKELLGDLAGSSIGKYYAYNLSPMMGVSINETIYHILFVMKKKFQILFSSTIRWMSTIQCGNKNFSLLKHF